jgi:hypothetical protein
LRASLPEEAGMKASRAAVMVALLGAVETACLVQVTHTSDPSRAFERARDEAVRDATRRGGPVSHLNLLAWDPGERKMVRVSVPLWLLRGAEREIDWDDVDFEGGRRDRERWRRRMGKLRWEDIERAGPGILMEVTEDEGDRVLIWLR